LAAATNRPDPSFAVSALTLLRQNSIVEAAQLCASGVEHYPDYIGGYILLASAFEALGQREDAALIRDALRIRFPQLEGVKTYELGQDSELDRELEAEPELEIAAEPESEAELGPEPEVEVEPEQDAEQVLVEEPVIVKIHDEPVAVAESAIVEEIHVETETAAVRTASDSETTPEFVELDEVVVEQPSYIAPSHPNVLRLIEMAPLSTDTRIIRSANVRLIPGLEFTSLRFEGTRSRGRREIAPLLDPPAFRTFHQMRRTMRPTDAGEQRKKPVTLEELAARLNDARMPRNAIVDPEVSREDLSAQQAPIIITETIARIYVQQGSYELAIDAFKALQKQKPEKHGEYEKLIKECERKRS